MRNRTDISLIIIMVRVFANGFEAGGSIPGKAKPKIQKIVDYASLLKITL